MYVDTFQSDRSDVRKYERLQRVDGAGAANFKFSHRRTRIDRLYQRGSAKIRFPRTSNDPLEMVLINTAGGLTGGDQMNWDFQLGKRTTLIATTQACEKSYKSLSGKAHQNTSIKMENESSLFWLPQETILYEGSALSRELTIEMGRNCSLLAMEALVLGRDAMGENLSEFHFFERWRIRQNDRAMYADDLKLDPSFRSNAKLGDHRAFASLIFIAPKNNELLDNLVSRLRKICSAVTAGFSAFDGKITGRILAGSSLELRMYLIPILQVLRGGSLPRVWSF